MFIKFSSLIRFYLFRAAIKTKPSDLKGVRELVTVPVGQPSLFVRKPPYIGGSLTWEGLVTDERITRFPPALTVNQVWGSDETGLTLPKSWFYCKWEPAKLQGEIYVRPWDDFKFDWYIRLFFYYVPVWAECSDKTGKAYKFRLPGQAG